MSMSPRHPVEPVADRDDAPAPASPSRRRFVRTVGMGAAALGAAAATGTALGGVASAQSTSSSEPPELGAGDVALLRFLQSISLAAEDALTAAADERYLEADLGEQFRTFSRHHRNHAATFGALLSDADMVSAPNAKLLGEVTRDIDGAGDQDALLRAVQGFEERLAATFLVAVSDAESWLAAGPIATVLPVVDQQAAAIAQELDLPVGEWLPTFASTDGAYTQAAYPVS
jgi:hypothetical protein